MRRMLKAAACIAAGAMAAVQFVRPERSNPSSSTAGDVAARLEVPPAVRGVLERSCRDCHSNDTRWPWYSEVAPVSWFVADHVNHGRTHLNLSQWSSYPPDRAATLLDSACAMARDGSMPLRSYLLMHPGARLSPDDIAALCDWTREASARLAGAPH